TTTPTTSSTESTTPTTSTTTTTDTTATTTTTTATTTSTTLPPCPGLVALTGKSLWLKAGVGMTVDNTGLVSQWPDQSGLAHDASASGTDRPQYVLSDPNGCPAVQFDGSTTR